MEEDIKLLEEKISDGTIYVMCGNSVDEAIKNILTALHKANKEKHSQKDLRRFNERKYRKVSSAHKEALNYIKKLEEENENLKQAIKINQDLYETKCNENKELENDLTSVYISGVYDERSKWQSKVKEKIEEIELKHKNDCLVIHEIEKDAQIRVLQGLLES